MFLLDTHVAIWWFNGDLRLGQKTVNLLSTHECFFSVVSLWEIQIKFALGKLPFSAREISSLFADSGVSVLPVYDRHVFMLEEIKTIHKDPFDRLLLATSASESIKFVTADSLILKQKSLLIVDATK